MPHFEDILPEPDDAAFDPDTDAKEMFEISGSQPGGGDSFSLENAEAVLVYMIDWRKARAFTRWCLGFSYADNGSPYRIRRENPQFHPRFPDLSASTVHFASFAPKANPEGGLPDGGPNYPSVFVEPDAINKMGYYESCYATVRYVRREWTFRPDAFVTDVASELQRNSVVTPTPVVELLQAEGGVSQIRWSETRPPSGEPPVGGPPIAGDEANITNIFAERLSKVRLMLSWYWVPESYLSRDPLLFLPEKLFRSIGTVNNAPFLGRPAGTLLMDAPKMDRFRFPVSTFDGLYPFFGWNIHVPLTYFNPRLGVPDTDPADNNKARGHRTLPWRADGMFYAAKRKNGAFYIDESDFSVAFQHIDQ